MDANVGKGLRVLSCFDGIACGLVALKRAGIEVAEYYASEIDPYAMKIAKKNHPEIMHIGTISDWPEWKFDEGFFDLIIGGSPCQGFSGAGKGLNFDDPRSKLYFEFERILKLYQPKYWLLENVKMKAEWRDIISERLGVKPVLINSALVSAQNRERLYWANFPISQPEDRGILLKDVILSDVWPVVLDGLRGKNGCFGEGFPRVTTDKSPALRTPSGGGNIPSFVVAGRRQMRADRFLELRKDNKSSTVVAIPEKCLMVFPLQLSSKECEYMNRAVGDGRTHWDFQHHSDVHNSKSAVVVANFFKGVPYNVLKDWDCIRKFHPIECERLQTLDDNYTEGVSDTRRYAAIGNRWTVEVIKHIFECLKCSWCGELHQGGPENCKNES